LTPFVPLGTMPTMCSADVLKKLADEGLPITKRQLKYAIKAGHVSRPRLNGSRAFDFTAADVGELRRHFKRKANQ
jgi:hypothetical protein